MKLLLSSLPFILVLTSVLHGQVNTPAVGHVRYADGSVRTVYGLPGNYIVGEIVSASIEAASFSNGGALLAKQTSLLLLDSKLATVASVDTPQPASVVYLDGDLTTAIAWLPGSDTLVHWNGQSFLKEAVSDLPEGSRVTSIRKLADGTASLLAVRADGTVVRYLASLETGALVSSTPVGGASGFAFEDGARIFSLVKGKVTAMSTSGEILKAFAASVDGDLTIEYAAGNCLHLGSKTSGREWLLHTAGNDFQLFQLPRPRNQDGAPVPLQPELAK